MTRLKRSPPRGYSDKIRQNPTKSDQVRPSLTKSDQIRPNPTNSDQIRLSPTELTKNQNPTKFDRNLTGQKVINKKSFFLIYLIPFNFWPPYIFGWDGRRLDLEGPKKSFWMAEILPKPPPRDWFRIFITQVARYRGLVGTFSYCVPALYISILEGNPADKSLR